MFQHQYGTSANLSWGDEKFLELGKLREMRDKFMPDGDLQVNVRIRKFVKAKDAAELRKCSVAEVLKQVPRRS